MKLNKIIKLHWKLYFPLVGLLWLIIGITIAYMINYEKRTRTEELENQLHNINASVIDAYNRGENLQNVVNFLRIYTDKTTLAPLRLTVYDNNGNMIADNPETTILLHDNNGSPIPELTGLINDNDNYTKIRSMVIDSTKCMVNATKSNDKKIYSFAALPYQNEVLAFINIDPMVWIIILGLGVIISITAFIGLKSTCRDIYSLQKFAKAISDDKIPNAESLTFSKDELGDVSRNLVTIYHDKIQAEQSKVDNERLATRNIQHELRTPVGIIKGYLDTVLEDNDMSNDIKNQFLIRAKQNADRLVGLIQTVSDFTHLEDGAKPSDYKSFNLYDTIRLFAEDIKTGDILKNMSFTYNIPQDCMAYGNESLIINALINLVNNAVKYSGGTLITFQWIKTETNRHHFIFADNGCGIDNNHLDKIFDPFYRINTHRTNKECGMGLGLSIVYRTIIALDCNITVKNNPDGGLVYNFTLPVG